jgi:hypothetical protein
MPKVSGSKASDIRHIQLLYNISIIQRVGEACSTYAGQERCI